MISIFLPILGLLIAAAFLWYVISNAVKSRVIVTSVAIATLTTFFVMIWFGIGSIRGWSVDKSVLFDEFEIIGINVVEPNKVTKDEGCIYLWAKNDNPDNESPNIFVEYIKNIGYKPKPYEPRCFSFPYTEENHQKADEIAEMLKQGKIVKGKKSGGGDLNGSAEGDMNGSESGDPDGLGREDGEKGQRGTTFGGDFNFFNPQDLPLPPKQ